MPKLGQIRFNAADSSTSKWLETTVASKVYIKKSSSLTQLIFFRENMLSYCKVVRM